MVAFDLEIKGEVVSYVGTWGKTVKGRQNSKDC